jgi:cyclophilin family peptidyl-prolyl cis-trans isomerase
VPALFCVMLLGCSTTKSRTTLSPAEPPAKSDTHPGDPLVYVRMKTTLGDIDLELNREKSPLSVANFLIYADRGDYDGTIFHRVVKDFVIQGGGYTKELKELPNGGTIMNEWQNGLSNKRGTIAMARDEAPDTATREFYINVKDNDVLDTARPQTGNAGYAVFGRVVAGMDVVDKIRMLPVTTLADPGGSRDPERAMKNVPVDPPVILKVERL